MPKLISKNEDFAKWYEQVILHANLASVGLVKGSFLLHPRSTYIWERIQKYLNREFKKHKINNVLFPALIPINELDKEKQSLTGFIPELFLVKKNNSDDKNENIFLRPTSEILFSYYFQRQLQSYTDLPILVNQWCNVYRVEKNTKFFLRSSEFYWQEAHTVHLTEEDAKKYLNFFHEIYSNLIVNFLKISVLSGEKTIGERFVGADKTLTIEGIMTDGQVLQMATSHYLGQNFSKIFGIKYTNKDNVQDNPYQLSAGCSTRLIGAVIMSHSDDKGLVLPWDLFEISVKVLVIDNVVKEDSELYFMINDHLKKTSFKFEWDFSNLTFGHKMMDAELKGTPIVLVIGKKEVDAKTVLFKSRVREEKVHISADKIHDELIKARVQFDELLKKANHKNLMNSIVKTHTLEETISVINDKKVALVPWFDDEQNEQLFKSKNYGFTPRCIKERLDDDTELKCFFSSKKANCLAYFGRSY